MFLNNYISKKALSLFHSMDIRHGEKKIVALCMTYALTTGFSQVFLKIIPMVLFLGHYSATSLPYIYIGSAIVLVVMGILYSLLQRYLTITVLLSNFVLVLAASIFVFWAAIVFSNTRWLFLVLIIWSQVGFDILDLAFWSTLNRLFTLDQAKRTFGIIGTSQTLATIIGNFSIPLFLIWIGSKNIMLLCSLGIFSTFVVLKFIFTIFYKRFNLIATNNISPQDFIESEPKIFSVVKNSYLMHNIIFALCSLFIYTIVDLLFYMQTKAVFMNEESLGQFLGFFFALLNIFDLFNRSITANFLIRKIGVKAGLLARSISVGILVIILIILLFLHSEVYNIFLLCALIKLFDEGLSNSVLRQSVLILYQPLTPKLRTWLQSNIELIVIPIATIAASLTLIALNTFATIAPLHLTLLILGGIIVTFILISRLQSGYISHLKFALAKRRPISPRLQYLDKRHSNFLLQKIIHGKPNEVVYSLNLIEKYDKKLLMKSIAFCLTSNNKDILTAALNSLLRVRNKIFIDQVKTMIFNTIDIDIQALALRVLIFQKARKTDYIIQQYLNAKEPKLQDIAIVAADRHSRNRIIQKEAQHIFQKLFSSQKPDKRIRAAKLIGQLEQSHGNEYLETLLQDNDPDVVNAAIVTAGCIGNTTVYLSIVQKLNAERYYHSASLALIQAGNKAIDILSQSLTNAFYKNNRKLIRTLIKIIAHIKNDQAKTILLTSLNKTSSKTLKYYIFRIFAIRDYEFNSNEAKQIIELYFTREIEYFKRIFSFLQIIGNDSQYQLLYSTFIRQLNSSKKAIFMLLKFIYPKDLMREIAFNLDQGDVDRMSYANELLEHILSATHKNLLLPLFEQQIQQNELRMRAEPEAVNEILRQILQLPTSEISGIVKSVAIYTVQKLNIESLFDLIENAVSDEKILIKETALWALAEINKRKL